MDKNVLIQYTDMIEEVKDIRKRILQTEKQISRIEEEGTVKDTVSGGMGGIQHFVVEGMPVLELSRKRLLLNKRKAMLLEKENELLKLTMQVDECIETIEKSELRIIFRLYFLLRRKILLSMSQHCFFCFAYHRIFQAGCKISLCSSVC